MSCLTICCNFLICNGSYSSLHDIFLQIIMNKTTIFWSYPGMSWKQEPELWWDFKTSSTLSSQMNMNFCIILDRAVYINGFGSLLKLFCFAVAFFSVILYRRIGRDSTVAVFTFWLKLGSEGRQKNIYIINK